MCVCVCVASQLFAIAPAEPEETLDPLGSGAVLRRASDHSMLYMLTGRVLLGVGGESLCAAASAILARWFRGSSWLTFACGFNQALVQLLGSAAVFIILPSIVRSGGRSAAAAAAPESNTAAGDADTLVLQQHQLNAHVRLCLWVTVAVCALSLAANLVYALVQWRYEEAYLPPPDDAEAEAEAEIEAEASSSLALAEEDGESKPLLASPSSSVPAAPHSGGWADLRGFSRLFWLVLLMHGLLSPILYTLTAFGPLALMERYEISEQEAARDTAGLYIAIVLSPLFGMMIDLTGRRSLWQLVAAVSIPVQLALMCTVKSIPPAILMAGIGVSYAITVRTHRLAQLRWHRSFRNPAVMEAQA